MKISDRAEYVLWVMPAAEEFQSIEMCSPGMIAPTYSRVKKNCFRVPVCEHTEIELTANKPANIFYETCFDKLK